MNRSNRRVSVLILVINFPEEVSCGDFQLYILILSGQLCAGDHDQRGCKVAIIYISLVHQENVPELYWHVIGSMALMALVLVDAGQHGYVGIDDRFQL